MSTGPDSPAQHGPWSMPANFLPIPEGFTSVNSTRIDLGTKTTSQLRALAAKHNSRHGIKQDPFQTTLHGIPERAKLRPDSKVATTNTIGTLLPAETPYAKAWRSIKRQVKAGKGDTAAKRAEAIAAAARLAKLQPKTTADPNKPVQRQLQQLVVPPEQLRWRSKLSGFLGRPVDVPQLAPGAPVLDMNKLFTEVMNRGGCAAVTAVNGWPEVAFDLQRDSELAEIVQAVYQCYLHPLELDLPYGFRPARNIDHLDSKAQLRGSMGPRLSTYDAVAYTADKASTAVQQVMPWASKPAAVLDLLQQEDSAKHPSQLVHAAVQLLRDAALCADVVAEQLLQHGLLAALHKPSQEACMARTRRLHSSGRHSRSAAELDDADIVVEDIKEDFAVVRAAAVAHKQAGTVGGKRPAPDAGTDTAGASGGAVIAAAEQDAAADSQQHQQGVGAATQSSPEQEQLAEFVATKRARRSSYLGITQKQQPQAAVQVVPSIESPAATGIMQPDEQQVNAARWLLLSLRAVRSGPPGCDKPLLWLPGMEASTKIDSTNRRSSEGGSGKVTGSGKKAFYGITPKCGKCKTCLHPSMKKACMTNKERIAKGLAPILPADSNGEKV